MATFLALVSFSFQTNITICVPITRERTIRSKHLVSMLHLVYSLTNKGGHMFVKGKNGIVILARTRPCNEI